mmetsp:Transcript_37478/g.81765  ORF Transcript_37478/g.81765 Transcript_37478/m.81765 type:complete len:301 (-) Transcript_37478:204-1106(-)
MAEDFVLLLPRAKTAVRIVQDHRRTWTLHLKRPERSAAIPHEAVDASRQRRQLAARADPGPHGALPVGVGVEVGGAVWPRAIATLVVAEVAVGVGVRLWLRLRDRVQLHIQLFQHWSALSSDVMHNLEKAPQGVALRPRNACKAVCATGAGRLICMAHIEEVLLPLHVLVRDRAVRQYSRLHTQLFKEHGVHLEKGDLPEGVLDVRGLRHSFKVREAQASEVAGYFVEELSRVFVALLVGEEEHLVSIDVQEPSEAIPLCLIERVLSDKHLPCLHIVDLGIQVHGIPVDRERLLFPLVVP